MKPIHTVKINNQITAPELRVIGEKGENLGVMKRDDALALAQEKQTDLIEVSPHAKPPVSRLMSFDKFRYEEEKKLKKWRAAQRAQTNKQVQVSGRTARNDLLIKSRKVEEFLKEGHQVTIVLRLRGREKGKKDWAMQKLKEFFEIITAPYQVVAQPKVAGRGIMATISPKPK